MAGPAILALEDGSIFRGVSIGREGEAVGEVVFNTAMTGYQEILSDPSYARQIVTLTYPHIGNTGCNDEDMESDRVWASGLVIRDLPLLVSNFRSQMTLSEFLEREGVVAIAEIDTRRLTRLIREKGALGGVILAGEAAQVDDAAAVAKARAFPGLQGMDLAKDVSAAESYAWEEGVWQLGSGYPQVSAADADFRVVAYDFGVKRNILRLLVDRGCAVTVVPATTPAAAVLEMAPDGVFLSNGPGDPEPCTYAIEAIRSFLEAGVPQFGICLGHQLLGLAAGARTMKMGHGHHGANHPVKDLASGRVMITSQNHGFAVDGDSLPAHLEATHVSLFDGSLQGMRHRDAPAFGFQGHPEASPGPQDAEGLFDRFVELMAEVRGN
ncbi:MAG TPA: glutamine-hydrolyzing carbamoyl-phosphate synthase small subunit [Pseudomonadales bacterium]|nr:glutamine-hydrolyzing carbamoyl-phosphate synthase small subunit [Pseudomonadales bacterium]